MPSYTFRFYGPRVEKKLRTSLLRGMTKAAEHVLGETKKVVPIDEAALSRSGTATVNPATAVAAISYDTPYAVKQHEDLELRHAPGRTAKYLEGPLNASGDEVLALIAAQIRRATQ